ncbi:hypothetical protein B0H11DRAFT_2198109 [Mycena galericulata]|nr:hypothetical protein B0H11DRAFT_2198109 [Mycena galericulata]
MWKDAAVVWKDAAVSAADAAKYPSPKYTLQEPVEGSSDDFPVVLSGDRTSDFRYLLKYIYAPVMDIQIDAIPLSAIPEIVAVASFADKYDIGNWKHWALSFVARRVFDPPERKVASKKLDQQPPVATPLLDISAHSLESLYVLYHRLGDHANRNLVMRTWCDRVEAKKLPAADAMNAEKAFGDAKALLALYIIQFRCMKSHAHLLEPTPFPVDNIAPIDFQRMFAGHTSLSLAWERLRSEYLPFPFQAGSCVSLHTHTAQCLPLYQKRWKEAMRDAEICWPDITNFYNRLVAMHDYLRTYNWLEDDGKCFLDFLDSRNGTKSFKNFRVDAHFFPEKYRESPATSTTS